MRLLAFIGVMCGLAACPRIEPAEQPPARIEAGAGEATCIPELCGREVAVRTSLAPGTELTAAECDKVCAAAWCGVPPIARNSLMNAQGCSLVSATSVSCTAIAYDCGYSFGCTPSGNCGPSLCRTASSTAPCCGTFAPQCTGKEAACADCPAADARCSASACASFKACGGALDTEPDPSQCANADGGVDPSINLESFCPDACNAKHAGAEVEACPGDAGVVVDAGSGSCVDDCAASRATCVDACPRTSFGDCMSCSANCGVKFGQCRRACP
ncbi:MAG: hypothetical protein QM817_19500 [Archangium sp.]